MLALLFSTVACVGALGTVGPVAVPCERLPAAEKGGWSCDAAIQLLRTEAVALAMRDASVYPSPEEIERRLDRHFPSRSAAQARANTHREEQRHLAAAVRESRADPKHDEDVWRRHLEGRMTYDQWVALRTKINDAPVADPQGDVALTEESFQALRAQLRPRVLEELFQEWVRGPWSLQERKKAETNWTPELQDAFWAKFLASRPMALHSKLDCNPIVPASLRGPGNRSPGAEDARRK